MKVGSIVDIGWRTWGNEGEDSTEYKMEILDGENIDVSKLSSENLTLLRVLEERPLSLRAALQC